MSLRLELMSVVDGLLADRAPKSTIELDEIGEALGRRAASSEEIDTMLGVIEKRGYRIVTRAGGGGEATLKTVLIAARALKIELGRVPRGGEIAQRTGLRLVEVQHALALARIMQR